MNNLKSYIEDYINRLVYEEGEAVGAAVVGTPANTLGMGNPMTPTDIQPGSEPIVTAKSRKEKKNKSKTKKLKESLLDDEDVLANNVSVAEFEYIKKEIVDLITNHKVNDRPVNNINSRYKYENFHISYDTTTKSLTLNRDSGIINTLHIPILQVIDLLKSHGIDVKDIISDNNLSLDNTGDTKDLENLSIKCNGVGFRGFRTIKNVTYQSIGGKQFDFINILDFHRVKLENFNYVANINKQQLPHRLNDVTYRNHQIKARALRISDINNIELSKPIKNITDLGLDDAGLEQKNGIIDVMSKHFIPGVACFYDMTTDKTVTANNLNKYFSMLKNYKRYSLKEHVKIFDCDFRDVLKLPDLQIITSGDCWSNYRLVVYCNDQEDWGVVILRK